MGDKKVVRDFLVNNDSEVQDINKEFILSMIDIELEIKHLKEDAKVITAEAKIRGVDVKECKKVISELKKKMKQKTSQESEKFVKIYDEFSKDLTINERVEALVSKD